MNRVHKIYTDACLLARAQLLYLSDKYINPLIFKFFLLKDTEVLSELQVNSYQSRIRNSLF